jgi:hypothetical protein
VPTDDGHRASESPRRNERSDTRHRGPHPAAAVDPERSIDAIVDEDALDAALTIAPRGALAWAISAVVLMFVAWLALYFLLFIPRGPIA